jgi:transposase InsO family protein
MSVMGKGSVRFEVNGIILTVSDVYFVPDLTNNLLSLGQLQERRLVIIIKEGACKIYHPQRGKILDRNMTMNRMFVIHAALKPLPRKCLKVEEENLENLWHRRYEHVNHKFIVAMQKKQMVKGLPKFKETAGVCEVCNIGKQHRDKIPKKSNWRASEKLELVHADLCGPITPISHSGKRYLLVFVDDYSRKTWIYFLVEKGETFEIFKCFKNLVEKEAQKHICCLRTDQGGEFTSNEFNQFCLENGIKRQLTAAFTPQQNGVAERRNRTIMNMVRCLLTEKEMPKTLWAEAAKWTNHVINRSLTKAVKEMVPEERWSGMKPRVDYFRVFGSIAHVHIPEQKRTKLDDRSRKCILIGVSDESKAYRLYDPILKKITVSRDVIFEEGEKWNWNVNSEEGKITLDWGDDGSDMEDSNEELDIETEVINAGNHEHTLQIEERQHEVQQHKERPIRERRPPSRLQDYESGEGHSEEEQEVRMVLFMSNDDPTNYKEAMNDVKWIEAMKRKIDSIGKNKTWELVNLPTQAKKIGVKWIYKTKLNEEGKVDKYKARLVAKGYTQTEGVDYNEVYAPVARWDTIRILLAVAAQKGWNVYQLDVKSPFLYG